MIVKVRDFIYGISEVCLSLVRIIVLSRFNVKFPKGETSKDNTCVILANGPSLRESLKTNRAFIEKHKNLVVNNFVYSDYYSEVKPNYYVLNSPEYFMEKGPGPMHEDMRERVFGGIVEKTTWPMFVFVPMIAAKTDVWKKRLAQNKNLKVVYYNSTPVEGAFSIIKYLFKYNMGMSRPHNVLIPSLFVTLNMGFKKIFLFGADHSWLEELRVNEDNRLAVNHEHFYDAAKEVGVMYKLDGNSYKIHEALRKLYLAFKGYWVILDYAHTLNAEIYNATPKSYIDAFVRVKV